MPTTRRMLIVAGLLLASAAAAVAGEYRLGPEDQVKIRIFDLRTGSGEAYKWTAFDADYVYSVGASGTLSVPLLGEVQAAGETTAEVAENIGHKLQSRVGLATAPDATVQIVKHRPFYVSGVVEKPGDYEFHPGLTVLQAVSMAGGVARASGDALLGPTRDAIVSRGDLRLLGVQRVALEARQARLKAEIDGVDAITWTARLQSERDDSEAGRVMREEELLFSSRRESIQVQTEILKRSKILLQSQIESLKSKDETLTRQLDLSKKELDQVTTLVSRGLAAMPRQLALEQSTAQYQSDRLDLQLATLRAQQDVTKADQDIATLINTRRNDALQEATEVRGKLAEVTEKFATSQALIFQAEVRAPAVLATEDVVATPEYFLTRQVDGRMQTLPAQEGDAVLPGDVVRIQLKGAAAGASALLREPSLPAGAVSKID